MTLTKNQFKEIILSLKTQSDIDDKNANLFSQIFKDVFTANLLYDNSLLYSAIFTILEIIFNDKNKWIQYWVYDLDFGKEYSDGKVIDKKGKNIKLESVDDLYNLLTSNKK